MKKYPVVSCIIPNRNEEHYIAHCLDSILANDYPEDRLEILVIDGMSTDRSLEIIQEYISRYMFIKLINNPKGTVSTALNIGIRKANGEIIVRFDAHTTYAPDYIRQCVTLLQTTEAANVGGMMQAVGTSYISDAIAIAVTSLFGTGGARYRCSNREEWVDTVFPGAWYKSTLKSLVGFNEEWVANEDYELNYRLRQTGGKILLSPKLIYQYYVRSTLKTLILQYFNYGLWKVKTLVAHPGSLQLRQLVPPVFALALVVSLLFFSVSFTAGIIVPGLYSMANLAASIWAARRHGWKYFPLLPIIFVSLHLSWAMGFSAGLARFGIPCLSSKSLLSFCSRK